MSLRDRRWQWKKKYWHRDPYEFQGASTININNKKVSLPKIDRMGTLVIKDPKTKSLHLIGTVVSEDVNQT